MKKENMTTFNSPQMLRRYSDGYLRIVTYDKINQSDEIVFKNEKWVDEKGVVLDIRSSKKSSGIFDGFNIPTSYCLKVAPIKKSEDDTHRPL